MSARTLMYSVAIGFLCLFAQFVPSPRAAFAAATITVNTTADDANSCTATHCSLRAALIKADADVSGDTINFTIPSSDPGCAGTPPVCTIYPLTPLPTLTASRTKINGYSQPKSATNTHLATSRTGGDTAVILIQLDGSALTPPPSGVLYGLDVTGANNSIKGLSITAFPDAIGLEGDGAVGNTVAGDFLGIAPKGSASTAGSGIGVKSDPTAANHAGANTIGGTTAAAANLIDTDGGGIELTRRDGSVIRGNFFGLNRAGAAAIATLGGFAAWLNTSDNTQVLDNLIAGYYQPLRSSTSNALRFASNITGMTAKGDAPLLGGTVTISGGSGAVIGGTSAADGNQLVGTTVQVLKADGATISHNLIGTDASGEHVLAGGTLDLVGNNTAGHNQPASVVDNVIVAGQSQTPDIAIGGDNGTRLLGNMIGVDKTGKVSLHSPGEGVDVSYLSTGSADVQATNITIGDPATGDGNVISGHGNTGIRLVGGNGVTIQGNRIGTDVTGATALGNAGFGIDIVSDFDPDTNKSVSPTNILIGGTTSGSGNVISGNQLGGVQMSDLANSSGTVTVQGSRIGASADGQQALPNGGPGLNLDDLGAVTVGGSAAGAGNEIAGNTGDGLDIYNVKTGVVQGNWIGTDPTGALHLGNAQNGIGAAPVGSALIGTPDSTGKPNRIAFNGAAGVAVSAFAGKPTTIEENAIYSNGKLGIDLAPSVGPMKDATGDRINCVTAPTVNAGVLCPVIGAATPTQISGSAGKGQRIEVFVATHDPSDVGFDSTGHSAHFGEGKVLLGATTSAATGPQAGRWSFTVPQGITLRSGQWITATATDSGGNTSEFAENVRVS